MLSLRVVYKKGVLYSVGVLYRLGMSYRGRMLFLVWVFYIKRGALYRQKWFHLGKEGLICISRGVLGRDEDNFPTLGDK